MTRGDRAAGGTGAASAASTSVQPPGEGAGPVVGAGPAPPPDGDRRGWQVVGVLAATETVSWGVLHYAFAVLTLPVQSDLDASAAVVTGAFSLSLLVSALLAVPVGRLLDAHGPRGVMTVGAVLAAVGVAAWARADSVAALYAAFALIGVARSAVLYEPAFTAVVQWFGARSRRPLLVVTLVAGLASTVAVPTTTVLAERLGWRDTLLVLAAVLVVTTAVPHALWLLRPPGRAVPVPRRRPAALTEAVDVLRDARLRRLVVAFSANAFATVVVATHLIAALSEAGHPATFTGVVAGSLGVLSVTGRVLLTAATRRWDTARVAGSVFVVQAGGALGLLLAPSSAGTVAGGVVLIGLGLGVGTLARPALLAEAVGTARFGTVSGAVAVAVTTATTAGPVAAGLLRTAGGGYGPVLAVVAAALLLSGATLLRRPRRTPDVHLPSA
ncbi:MFS transporter [Thalassiella azotivora]